MYFYRMSTPCRGLLHNTNFYDLNASQNKGAGMNSNVTRCPKTTKYYLPALPYTISVNTSIVFHVFEDLFHIGVHIINEENIIFCVLFFPNELWIITD